MGENLRISIESRLVNIGILFYWLIIIIPIYNWVVFHPLKKPLSHLVHRFSPMVLPRIYPPQVAKVRLRVGIVRSASLRSGGNLEAQLHTGEAFR